MLNSDFKSAIAMLYHTIQLIFYMNALYNFNMFIILFMQCPLSQNAIHIFIHDSYKYAYLILIK
jgi:hypothetical protein